MKDRNNHFLESFFIRRHAKLMLPSGQKDLSLLLCIVGSLDGLALKLLPVQVCLSTVTYCIYVSYFTDLVANFDCFSSDMTRPLCCDFAAGHESSIQLYNHPDFCMQACA